MHHTPHRRSFLKLMAGAAGAALLPCNTPWADTRQQTTGGCFLLDSGTSQELLSQSRLGLPGASHSLETYGDDRFYQAMGTMLADLAGRFQVRPGFGFYDDGKPNAKALPNNQFQHSHGTVLFGREMLNIGMRGNYGDMFVMGICAHEFAHIVQYFTGYHDRLNRGQPTQKRVELHADFLSGYYIGLRDTHYLAGELVALGQTWATLGDSDYTNEGHHGTPEERLRAIEEGFKFARNRPGFHIKDACEVGARYLEA